MTYLQATELAAKNMERIDYYPRYLEQAQKFLQDHEGEDSDEMLAQDLARWLSIVWEAGKIYMSLSRSSSCME